MNGIKTTFFVVALVLCACTDRRVTAQDPSPPAEELIVLDWDQLLPSGENDRLDQAYGEYFANLDAKIAQNMSIMTASGPSSVDTIEEGSALDAMPQLGTFNTVDELDGKYISLPGFIVPLDFESTDKLSEFLFVPYFGACIHTPPPPPNQIVYVKGDVSFRENDMYTPYWADGILSTQAHKNDIGSAAYTLTLTALRPYEY